MEKLLVVLMSDLFERGVAPGFFFLCNRFRGIHHDFHNDLSAILLNMNKHVKKVGVSCLSIRALCVYCLEDQ